MAGYTGSPFRIICRELGATGLGTEMVTAAGVSRRSVKTMRSIRFDPMERPLGIQLFGARPGDFARSAELVADLGFSFIDINAGCPVKKVLKSGSGSALLRDLPRLAAIVRETSAASPLPVTVKIRLGFTPEEPLSEGVCEMLCDAGATALTIHGRYRSDMFGGSVDLAGLERLSGRSPVPVVANGDVRTPEDGRRLMSLKGVTGVMVGRGALGNPWIFRRLSGGAASPAPGELRSVVMKHLDLTLADGAGSGAVHSFRGHLIHYLKGFPGAAGLRDAAVRVNSREDVAELVETAERRVFG